MEQIERQILERFERTMDWMVERGRTELSQQGHRASGRLMDSMEAVITAFGNDTVRALILVEHYGLIQDAGVSADRIPFSPGSGATRSKLIAALLEWSERPTVKPGLSDKERRSFVFAVAHNMKLQGMPTVGARSFSSNGQRTGWIDAAWSGREVEEEFLRRLDLDSAVVAAFERTILEAAT